jgi:hypothetical protein
VIRFPVVTAFFDAIRERNAEKFKATAAGLVASVTILDGDGPEAA